LLIQLFIYLDTIPDMVIRGHVLPDDLDGESSLRIVACCDADHAGDPATSRSTSGSATFLVGANSMFPIAWASNRQGRVAQSTAEAELVAFNDSLRKQLLPLMGRVEALLRVNIPRVQLCDSTACIGSVVNGASVALDYVRKTQRVSPAWLKDTLEEVCMAVRYVNTKDNPADIFTKHLSQPRLFELLECIGLVCPRFGVGSKMIKHFEVNWIVESLAGMAPAAPPNSTSTSSPTREVCEATEVVSVSD